mgnify:CR=1 FL=1
MIEVWIKKTIYRRYLVEESEIDEVKTILESNRYGKDVSELIEDMYDINDELEYDNEGTLLQVEYSLSSF